MESNTKHKPYISIIIPMMRPGGLDTIFESLEAQTFKDFELIMADSLYEYRKDIVKERGKKYSFSYKHIPTITNKFPVQSYCHAMNSAITNTSGEVILFTSDYRYFMPDTLQKHANFHKTHPDNFGYAPPSKFVFPPAMKSGIPSYGRNSDYDKYVSDLSSGVLDEYMWSIFDDDLFSSPQDLSKWPEIDRIKVGYDPKDIIPPNTEVSPMIIFLQSESVKIKMVLAANGLNEALDGAHSHQDIEFAHRLRNLFDFKWIGDNTAITYKVEGGHAIINKMKLIEAVDSAAASVFEKYKCGSKDPVNDWNLASVHAANQNVGV
jgi:glycosyltransferase involved in cell wall biosynthesis